LALRAKLKSKLPNDDVADYSTPAIKVSYAKLTAERVRDLFPTKTGITRRTLSESDSNTHFNNQNNHRNLANENGILDGKIYEFTST
jgi:hypothetical protein